MKSLEEIQTIIIIVYLVILAGAAIVAVSIYSEYVDSKKDNNLSAGGWTGGIFYANPQVVIPIEDKTENQTLQKIISRHKKAVTFFWIWILMLVPIIAILNLVD